jgi:hypothetical protein
MVFPTCPDLDARDQSRDLGLRRMMASDVGAGQRAGLDHGMAEASWPDPRISEQQRTQRMDKKKN